MTRRWLLLLLAAGPLAAQEAATVQNPNITISLIADPAAGAGGTRRALALVFRMAPGWHIYWRNPGAAGIATSVSWRLPAGARMDSLAWPVPEFHDVAGIATHVLHGEAVLLTAIGSPTGSRTGQVEARIRYGICKDVCVPGEATLRLDLARPANPTGWREVLRISAARRPRTGPGPTLVAESAPGGVDLVVRPTRQAPLPDTLTFYATDRETLPAAVRQAVPRGAREVRLRLPLGNRPARLAGVLVSGAPDRRQPTGWPVDVPVRGGAGRR